MSTINMLVVESPSRISKAIQVGTMRPANHAAIEYLPDGLVFEALFKGIEVTKSDQWWLSRSPKTTVHRCSCSVSSANYQLSLNAAWKHEKDKYDFRNLTVSLPLIRFFTKRFIKDEDMNWICSEFAEHLARLAGVNFVHKITKPSDCSPGTLLDSIRFEQNSYDVVRYS